MMLADDILLLYAKRTWYTSNLDKYIQLKLSAGTYSIDDFKRKQMLQFCKKKTRLESVSDWTLQAGQSRKLSIYHIQ